MAKLAEYRCGCSFEGVLVISEVGEIRHHADAVGDNE